MKRFILLATTLLVITSAVLSQTAEGPSKGEVDPKTGKVIKYWVAPMDPTYIRDEPGKSPMGMDLVPVYEEADDEQLPTSTIRIDPVTMQNMGVRTAEVRRAKLARSIRALGTVTYDESRIYAVNLKFDGWIERLHVNFVGEKVVAGQPLFEIYSPDLVAAQEEYLLALKQAEQLGDSQFPAIAKNASSLLAAARQRLLYWDLEKDQLRRLERSLQPAKTLTIHSPVDGIVIKKEAVAGHFAKAGMHQYEIADLSEVWVDVEVYEYELPFISEGMTAEMELSYLPGRLFTGKVLFIYPFLNPDTRTARLRLAFSNPEGRLKPDMYANVFLESVVDSDALVIPQEAVIDSGVRKMVFVALGEGKFEPRPVTLGVEGVDNTFQVLDGLKEGEKIVTSAQFMFDSESRLREAIQKMLSARTGEAKDGELTTDDLDMTDLEMGDDDLDMSNLQMNEQ